MLSILFNCILFKNAVLINCESFQVLFYIPLNMHLRLRLSFWLFDHPCTCRIFTPDYIKVVRKLVWLKFCRVIISSNHNVCVHVAFLEQAFCSFDLLLEHCVVITVDLNLSTETTSQVRLQFATFTPEQGLRNNFLPHDALYWKARYCDCMSSVCPSVFPPLTLVVEDHIGWKSWKLIARSNSPTPSLFVAQRPST